MAAVVARMRLPRAVQDLLLAVFVAYFQVRGTVLVGPGDPAKALAEPYHLGYFLLAATGLALAVRRRFPLAVFAALAVASALYYLAGYSDGPGWTSLFIAAYTLAAYGDGQKSLRVIAAAMGSLAVVWLLTADLSPLDAAGWVFFRIGAAIMAIALGESVRTRRIIADEATDRADRAEQTKEAEARQRADAERLRIARDVHDTLAHALAVINVHSSVMAHTLDKHPEQVLDTLVTIEHTSAQALRELRATLGLLRDTDDRAPVPGLGQIDQLMTIARMADLEVSVEVDGRARELPATVDQTAYRILQESITNVIRHADATRVTVALGYRDSDLYIRVADNGPRRKSGVDAAGGRGIAGMTERATLLGGRLTAAPDPGGGFHVTAELPLTLDPVAPS